ncbi:hypothetical protein ACFQPF_12945 [Fictibacillus iocasae]|uniref:Uncharacterized protein n=1 Tax=Fictibacillus iocasae TaxID=2715437 RepID=A0ABW2NU85_9BACL
MSKMLNWFIEPYSLTINELRYLKEISGKTESAKERMRIRELQAFNIVYLLFISGFLILSIVYVILSFITAWYAFTSLIISLPMIALAKRMQKKRYFKRRDAYIKNDVSLIKPD